MFALDATIHAAPISVRALAMEARFFEPYHFRTFRMLNEISGHRLQLHLQLLPQALRHFVAKGTRVNSR